MTCSYCDGAEAIIYTVKRFGATTTIKIPICSVIMIEADEKYSTIYHDKGEALISTPICELMKIYPEILIETKRGILVNIHRIQKITRHVNASIAGYIMEVVMNGTDSKGNILKARISRRHWGRTFKAFKRELAPE